MRSGREAEGSQPSLRGLITTEGLLVGSRELSSPKSPVRSERTVQLAKRQFSVVSDHTYSMTYT